MVSNTLAAHVSIRSITPPTMWAYEIVPAPPARPTRGIVDWDGPPDLNLIATVLTDYQAIVSPPLPAPTAPRKSQHKATP